MFSKIPIRLKLALGHAAWMALVFFIMGYSVFHVVKGNLYRSIDATLLSSAQSIRAARFDRGFNSPFMERFLHDFSGELPIRPYAQLVDLAGTVQVKTNHYVNLPVTRTALKRAELGLESFETFKLNSAANSPLRQVTLPVIQFGKFTGELIQVGVSLESTVHTLRQILWVLWLSLPLGLLVSIIFGYILTRRSLRPVVDMSEIASGLRSSDLSKRLGVPPAKDELRQLAETFNGVFDRLEDAFLRLRRFTGDVSHELRTPLAVLLGESELALRKQRTNEEYKKALAIIQKESKHMQTIIEDLLLLARAESKVVAMSWQKVKTKEFVQTLIQSVEAEFDKKNVKLEVHIEESIKEFEANLGYLSIALKNILLNAAKHSAPNQIVQFQVLWEDGGPCFRVLDRGEGIPTESLPFIFDPFYRADTARNRSLGGSGIGLSLALALVKLHGGQIFVESHPGRGSLFSVKWPHHAPSPA